MSKRILSVLISMKFMGGLMVVLAVSIALATFIENAYGTVAARALIYNTIWFELILALLIINLLGNVFKFNMVSKEKASLLIFHIAFILIIVGAFITRYLGEEGVVHIREGDRVNYYIEEGKYINIEVQNKDKLYDFSQKVHLSSLTQTSFSKCLKIDGKKVIFKSVDFVTNSKLYYSDSISDNASGSNLDKNRNAVLLKVLVSVDEKTKLINVWENTGSGSDSKRYSINGLNFKVTYGSRGKKLPFYIKLNNFLIERYPGSKSPSGFKSTVEIIDKDKGVEKKYVIFMNNVLKYRGYRFYQTSYDIDEKGTILTVNRDPIGILFTYSGYLLLGIGMFFSLFNKNSRFQKLRKANKILVFLFLLGNNVFASESTVWSDSLKNYTIDKKHASKFGELLIQDYHGRLKPINTFSSEILRKVSRSEKFNGLNSDQVVLSMLVYPEYWQKIPLIKVSDKELRDELGMNGKYISFNQLINSEGSEGYVLASKVEDACRMSPAERSRIEKEIVKVDERLNICYSLFYGTVLRIFPESEKSADGKWHSPKVLTRGANMRESAFYTLLFSSYCDEIHKAVKNNKWEIADIKVDEIASYQEKYGECILPSKSKINLEIMYNNWRIFDRVANYYGLFGVLLIIINFIALLTDHINWKYINYLGAGLLLIVFLFHTLGLGVRWYISDHAPWSNGYEALIYIGWTTMLAGFVFWKSAPIALPATSVLTTLILLVAHLSWMDPEVTTLVPVLQSIWLVFHVAIITTSYGFLALAFLLGVVNMLLMICFTDRNFKRLGSQIVKLTRVIEMTLIVGLYLLFIGTFLGGVWANESWGRYWGWDAKEAWALITCIVYAIIVHFRLIPGLKGIYTFNLVSIYGFSTVIMTYFGVNYYLTGLHSYAQGEPPSLPKGVMVAFVIILVINLLAYLRLQNTKKIKKWELNY